MYAMRTQHAKDDYFATPQPARQRTLARPDV